MNLLPRRLAERLPSLYATEGQGLDAIARVKFFDPASNWTWYAVEFDGEDILYGLVVGFEVELGYFSLTELQDARNLREQPLERDRHFKPTPLRVLVEQHKQ